MNSTTWQIFVVHQDNLNYQRCNRADFSGQPPPKRKPAIENFALENCKESNDCTPFCMQRPLIQV